MNKLSLSGCLLALVSLSLACDPDTLNGTDDDAGAPASGNDAGRDEGCDELSRPRGADETRLVLSGHSTEGIGGVETVHFLRSASLDVEDGLTDIGEQLDLTFLPVRIEMVPSGAFALVLGEQGQLASVRVGSDGALSLAHEVALSFFGMKDLRISSDGSEAFAVGADVTEETSGISVVKIGCEGELDIVEEAFFGLRLSHSLAFLPGEERAVLFGGQAAFEPIDNDDVRLLARAGEGFEQIASFDLYGDFVDLLRIAVSPDGSQLVIPNGSPFSAESHMALVATIEGDAIVESHRVAELEDAREALFSPDGETALVTLFSRNRVIVLADEGNGLEAVAEVTGVGLAEQMALISRGALSGTVLVTSVDATGGSNIARLQITAPGVVEDRGQLSLPEGLEYIPRAIAVQP